MMTALEEFLVSYLKRRIPIDEQFLQLDQELLKAIQVEIETRQKEQTGQINPLHQNNREEKQNEEELAKLPWKDFQNANGQWIKTTDAPSWLCDILKSRKTWTFSGYDYKLSGDQGQFLNRYHQKENGK